MTNEEDNARLKRHDNSGWTTSYIKVDTVHTIKIYDLTVTPEYIEYRGQRLDNVHEVYDALYKVLLGKPHVDRKDGE